MKFWLYNARHWFVSRAVKNEVDLLVLASILGHSNLKMVMRFAYLSETFKADAVWKTDRNRKSSQMTRLGYVIKYNNLLS